MRINTVNGNVVVTESEKRNEEIPEMVQIAQDDLAAMMFESMVDKLKVSALEETTANMAFEIMQLKMGGN